MVNVVETYSEYIAGPVSAGTGLLASCEAISVGTGLFGHFPWCDFSVV